jgi:hypothetical protein
MSEKLSTWEKDILAIWLENKVYKEMSELDTRVGKVEVTYQEKENGGILFAAHLELWDEDLEDYLPYAIQWLLNREQSLEWALNKENFDDYRLTA